MSLHRLKKEKVRSVIICKDREFRAKTIQFLNAAAFPAEKSSCEVMGEAIDKINDSDLCLNVVIEGGMYSPDGLEQAILQLADGCHNPDVNVLVYLDEAQLAEKDRFEELYPKLFLEREPQMQSQFNRAFHTKKMKTNLSDIAPIIDEGFKNKEATEQKQKFKTNALSIIETSAHIKDTIEMINDLGKRKYDLPLVVEIGQRFNGLIGAFHFFGNKEGYPKLRHLAEIIDSIGRTYENSSEEEIKEHHWNILVSAAKCSYLLLKDMRDGEGVKQENLDLHSKLTADFESMNDVRIRENFDQDEVDKMISEYEQSS